MEQCWQKFVQHVPSFKYMRGGTFRLVLLTLAQMDSMRRAKTPFRLQDQVLIIMGTRKPAHMHTHILKYTRALAGHHTA